MAPYLLGLYEKSMPGSLSLREKLTEAKTAGFDYMEISIDETDEKLARLDADAATRRDWVLAQIETGLPILSLCLSGHRRFPLGDPDPATRTKSLQIMEKAIVLAAQLGIRIIQLAGYDVYYQPSTQQSRDHFAKNLQRAAEMAARFGVTLAFETMETEFLNTVKKGMAWVHKIHSPWLQMYPDLGNITNAALGGDHSVESDSRCGAGHLAALHLKETRPGIFREVPYGEGHVDFATGAATAYALGVRLFVGEFWYSGQENWRYILRKNHSFLQGVLQKASLQANSTSLAYHT